MGMSASLMNTEKSTTITNVYLESLAWKYS